MANTGKSLIALLLLASCIGRAQITTGSTVIRYDTAHAKHGNVITEGDSIAFSKLAPMAIPYIGANQVQRSDTASLSWDEVLKLLKASNLTVVNNLKAGSITTVGGVPYQTGNQSITVSGDVSGSGATSINLTLPNIVTAATKTKVTYNAKGQVTGGADATTTDIGEGTNQYYTDARARASQSANSPATYNSSTGAHGVDTTIVSTVAHADSRTTFPTKGVPFSAGNQLSSDANHFWYDSAGQTLVTPSLEGYHQTSPFRSRRVGVNTNFWVEGRIWGDEWLAFTGTQVTPRPTALKYGVAIGDSIAVINDTTGYNIAQDMYVGAAGSNLDICSIDSKSHDTLFLHDIFRYTHAAGDSVALNRWRGMLGTISSWVSYAQGRTLKLGFDLTNTEAAIDTNTVEIANHARFKIRDYTGLLYGNAGNVGPATVSSPFSFSGGVLTNLVTATPTWGGEYEIGNFPNLTLTSNAVNFTNNTLAQAQDTSSLVANVTTSGKPSITMLGPTGNPVFIVDTNGNVNIGTSAPAATAAGRNYLALRGSANEGRIDFSTAAADADNGNLGYMQFQDILSTGTNKRRAAIQISLSGTTANKRGSRMMFQTAADNDGALVTALQLNSDASVSFANAKAQVNTNGKFNVVGNTNMEGMGIPGVLDSVLVVNSNTNQATTAFSNSSAAADYEVDGYVEITQAGTGSTTLTVTLGFTDDVGATTVNVLNAVSATSTTTRYSIHQNVHNAGANITYAATLGSATGTPIYHLHLWCKRID